MQNRSIPYYLLTLLILSACASIQPSVAHETQLSLVDGLGREVNLVSPAQHIVSLAPSNTEILYAIGAGNQVVARDDFSNYPEAALSLPAVGGFMGDYDYEAILAMKPDLVLASTLNTSGQVQSMEDLGITVYLLPNPVDLEGLYENILIVGQLTGHEANAASLKESLKIRVNKVTEKLATISQEPLAYYELDGSEPAKPWTPGPNTFLTKLIEMAGGKSVGEVLDSDYAQISLEELLIQDPDMIILGDSNYGVTAGQVAERAGWSSLTAVQSQAIHPFNDDLVSRPGPRLVDGLEALAQLLHPELFK